MRSNLRFAVLFGLVWSLVLVGCPEDSDDDDATADDDDATADDDDATADDDDATADDDDATADDDDVADDDDDSAVGDPGIRVVPATLDYGAILVGNARNMNLSVRNIGQAPLEIYEMTCPLPQISLTPFTGMIAPGGNEVVPVTATCSVMEEVGGVLRIRSNDPNVETLTVPITVLCEQPA